VKCLMGSSSYYWTHFLGFTLKLSGTETKAILIARIKDDAKRAELLAKVLAQNLSKRQIEQRLIGLKTKSDVYQRKPSTSRVLSRG
jgi:hypothetical protein